MSFSFRLRFFAAGELLPGKRPLLQRTRSQARFQRRPLFGKIVAMDGRQASRRSVSRRAEAAGFQAERLPASSSAREILRDFIFKETFDAIFTRVSRAGREFLTS